MSDENKNTEATTKDIENIDTAEKVETDVIRENSDNAPPPDGEASVSVVSTAAATAITADEKKKKRVKKIVGWVFTGIGIAIVAFLLFVVIVLAVDKYAHKSPVPSFFGRATLVVTTDSMSGTIEKGDMIIIDDCDEYAVGDIITFVDPSDNIVVTHRLIRIDGDKYFTRGDANNTEDPRYILKSDIVGKVTGRIPYVGLFAQWFTVEFGWLYLLAGVAVIAAGVVLVKYFAVPKKENKQ